MLDLNLSIFQVLVTKFCVYNVWSKQQLLKHDFNQKGAVKILELKHL